MFGLSKVDRRLWWGSVGLIALAALLLRVAASGGGLWTDEAWSMIYAEQARDPLGVFLRINHDNNHHLISLWLQLVGINAPPLLVRLPAILSGTASVLVAAYLAGRWSPLTAIAAALLFAFSPIMVTYGSEARGYAPMILAALTMLLLVLRSREQGPGKLMRWWLALVSLLGMLSHMTMIAPVVLIALWVYLDRRAVEGPKQALRTAAWLLGPALIAAMAVPAFVVAAASMSPTGMRVGGYIPFDWADFWQALMELAGWTFGLPGPVTWVPLLLLAALAAAWVAIRPPQWLGARARLYAILILGVPLAAMLFRPANTGFARYFLCSSIGLLLLASEWIGRLLAGTPSIRAAAGAGLGVILLFSLWQDRTLVEIERGHPEKIVQLMREASPSGAHLTLETDRLEATTKVSARRAGYQLDLVHGCSRADFLLSSEPKRLTDSGPFVHCGVTMRPIGFGSGTALTGDRWILYRADGMRQPQLASR